MQKYTEIYLVDDFEMVNTLHQILLRKLGTTAKVQTFTDPRLALENLRAAILRPESILVLLDINMPEMSGFEFLQQMTLEGFPSTMDVIIVTSSISDKDRALAMEYSQYVREYVTKPLKAEQLKAITESISKAV